MSEIKEASYDTEAEEADEAQKIQARKLYQ
jgi:hypothetical protein